MDEDLHSCIIESLDNPSTSMNARANIMYFLEHFCDMAGKPGTEGHTPYIDFVKRDLAKIVASVIGARGGANVKVVRRVVEDLKGKGVVNEEIVRGVEEVVRRKEVERAEKEDVDMGGSREAGKEKDRERERRHESDKNKHRSAKDAGAGGKNGHRVDKRAIEQRIEEDRERNKRLRESVWAVEGDDEDELNKLWEETSDLNDDDYLIAKEEAEERAQFARYHKSLLQEAVR